MAVVVVVVVDSEALVVIWVVVGVKMLLVELYQDAFLVFLF